MPQRKPPLVTSSTRRRYRSIWVEGTPLLALARLLAIENPVPAFGLDDAEAMLKPLPRRKWCSFGLRLGACKKQRIRHVVPRLGREVLLHRHLGPAKRFEKGPYELLLGLRLSRIVQLGECRE
jgi:hypothetical protein